MYPDGICKVTEKRYSKCIVFEDINYQLAQADDKTAIFENWCDFLNYFDASVSVQLSFINQGTQREQAEKAISIPAQKDAFNSIRTLTLTEEVEIRYRTETSTDPETGETTTEEVPYEYHILNVKLENKPISSFVSELLTPQQLEMFHVYLETSGNKPLIFGGGSPDGSPSEDLSGVEFVNGTRLGNQELMELAKQQVGNVGGYKGQSPCVGYCIRKLIANKY